MADERRLTVGTRELRLTHAEKVLFPADGITKSDLLDYYLRVADMMLPHLRDRPLTIQRYPGGIGGQGFMQKSAADYFPDWIPRFDVPKADGGTTSYPVCNEAAALAYLTNQNTIVHHVWPARIDRPDEPDLVIFDLDPAGTDFSEVRRAAGVVRAVLDELALPSFVKTSGSKGLHVVVPVRRGPSTEEVHAVAHSIAETVAGRDPDRLTTEFRKSERRGRLFVDTNRNGFAQTYVAPYSLRALPGAPVSMPVDWDEACSPRTHPRKWTLGNAFRRLGRKRDPWAGLSEAAAALDGVQTAVEGIRS